MAEDKLSKKKTGRALSYKEVVSRVLAGETVLFELLFRRHSQRIYRVARAILREEGEAVDLVQETYLRAYTHLDQFAGRAKFSTWLTKIAVSLARARARRRGGRREKDAALEREPQVAIGADPEQRAFGQEVKTILEAAIDALPDRYRTVFMLRGVEEMNTAETAECMNLSRDTVKTRLHRARALLREKLYVSVGQMGAKAFRFGGSRCERMTAELFVRMKLKVGKMPPLLKSRPQAAN